MTIHQPPDPPGQTNRVARPVVAVIHQEAAHPVVEIRREEISLRVMMARPVTDLTHHIKEGLFCSRKTPCGAGCPFLARPHLLSF
jgi:hypothetical protein